MYYLIKNSFNWADEIDFNGFDIISIDDLNEAKEVVKCLSYDEEYSVGIGSNEELYITRSELEDMLENAKPLSSIEVMVITQRLGTSCGKTLYSVFLNDPMQCLDEDSEEYAKLHELYTGEPYNPDAEDDEDEDDDVKDADTDDEELEEVDEEDKDEISEDAACFDDSEDADSDEEDESESEPEYRQHLAKEAVQTIVEFCKSRETCDDCCFAKDSEEECGLHHPFKWTYETDKERK